MSTKDPLGSIPGPKKLDLERSSYLGQLNKAQKANLNIAIINAGLFCLINPEDVGNVRLPQRWM